MILMLCFMLDHTFLQVRVYYVSVEVHTHLIIR